MTDREAPTPDEMAYELGIRMGWDLDTELRVVDLISLAERAAVAAERERCLNFVSDIECSCGISDEMTCGRCFAIRRIKAATIRRGEIK